MASARQAVYEGREATWADTFKAMGDPTRLSIFLKLIRGEQCVTDLSKALSLDAPTVSFHLTKLRYSGLLVNERRGQQVFYRINPELMKAGREGLVLDVDGCHLKFPK
jgi:DNA-binding transcriptional ArsR family regulator